MALLPAGVPELVTISPTRFTAPPSFEIVALPVLCEFAHETPNPAIEDAPGKLKEFETT